MKSQRNPSQRLKALCSQQPAPWFLAEFPFEAERSSPGQLAACRTALRCGLKQEDLDKREHFPDSNAGGLAVVSTDTPGGLHCSLAKGDCVIQVRGPHHRLEQMAFSSDLQDWVLSPSVLFFLGAARAGSLCRF